MQINDNIGLATIAQANFAANGAIGTAAATVDIASSFVVTQTTAGISVTLPSPTDTTAGLELNYINSGASTQSITVGGLVLTPGTMASFRWDGTAWASLSVGLRNMGASVLVASVVAGASVVTHNLAMPAGKFSSVIFRAYNAAGTEVVFKRNKAADTANVIGISNPVVVANITFDIVPLA
jgi:hypothetical protein